MGNMRHIDRQTLNSVVEEFASELKDIGLAFPRDADGLLEILDGALSETAAAQLRSQIGSNKSNDPWGRIAALDPALRTVRSVSADQPEPHDEQPAQCVRRLVQHRNAPGRRPGVVAGRSQSHRFRPVDRELEGREPES